MQYLMLAVLLISGFAIAEEPGMPKGDVLLTISGNIENPNSEHGAEFDRDMLVALGATSITTSSPWTDEPTTFTGVRLDVLLDTVGANSNDFRAIALDGYWYDTTNVDFEKYPVVLAYKRDGEFMSARNLGPLWIMFPFDDFPELLTHGNKASCVWQVNELVVK